MNCARGDWPKPKIVKNVFDIAKCQNVTALQKQYIEHCRKIVEDPDKEKRIKAKECVICFYSSKVGGSVLTYHMCESCGKEMSFVNTCVDVLCEDCAEKMRLCKHCGADMDMKLRRKL